MCLEDEAAVSASLDSPKHPPKPSKTSEGRSSPVLASNRIWEMFGRAQGPAPNCASDFSIHQTEGTRVPASRAVPRSCGRCSQHGPCPAELSPAEGPPRTARVWGHRARGVTRRSCPTLSRHSQAGSPCALLLPRSGCQMDPSQGLSSGSLCSSSTGSAHADPTAPPSPPARVIRPPLRSGGPAPLSFINSANAWLTGRQRQGRGGRLRQTDNHRARRTRQGRAGEMRALGCSLVWFLLYVPYLGDFP